MVTNQEKVAQALKDLGRYFAVVDGKDGDGIYRNIVDANKQHKRGWYMAGFDSEREARLFLGYARETGGTKINVGQYQEEKEKEQHNGEKMNTSEE